MNIIELTNDTFDVIGTGNDLFEYYKKMIIDCVEKEDFEMMRTFDMNEFADLFELFNDNEKLYKVSSYECDMDGTATMKAIELVEKGEQK